MSFALYVLGFIVVICGVGYMAHLMHLPQHWIFAICLILAGMGMVTAVTATRRKDPN